MLTFFFVILNTIFCVLTVTLITEKMKLGKIPKMVSKSDKVGGMIRKYVVLYQFIMHLDV
jgi:hypothetical protein